MDKFVNIEELRSWRLEQSWQFFVQQREQRDQQTFVKIRGLLSAGHAAQPQCWAST
jgi:hypothetical protein